MKKWIALIMTLTLVLLFSACGGAASSVAPASSAPASSEAEPASEVESEPVSEPESESESEPAASESVPEPASSSAVSKPAMLDGGEGATSVGGMLAGTWVLHGAGAEGFILTMEQLEAILATQSDPETAAMAEQFALFAGMQFVFNEDGTGTVSIPGEESAGMVDDFEWEDMGDATNFVINTASGDVINFSYDGETDQISVEADEATLIFARA